MEEEGKLTRKEKMTIMYTSFRTFMYDADKGEVMGRNAESWGKIGLFFFVYYSCLAAFFAAMFAIAFSTMPEIKDGPKYTSLIADKPLLLVSPEGGIGSWTTKDINGSIKNRYDNYLRKYRDTQCYLPEKCKAGESYRPEQADRQCGFNVTSLGPCAPNTTFGYEDKAPCLYLWLSKIYDWKPEPVGNAKYVGLECKAEDDEDTKFEYHPPSAEAFPISFWPFRGESVWRSPVAAVQVKGNKKEVKVKCWAIADNIERSDTYKLKKGAHGQLEFTVAAAPK